MAEPPKLHTYTVTVFYRGVGLDEVEVEASNDTEARLYAIMAYEMDADIVAKDGVEIRQDDDE